MLRVMLQSYIRCESVKAHLVIASKYYGSVPNVLNVTCWYRVIQFFVGRGGRGRCGKLPQLFFLAGLQAALIKITISCVSNRLNCYAKY